MTSLVNPIPCLAQGLCKHWRADFSGHFPAGISATCKAFPNGIPQAILFGEDQHRKPFEGDHGIQFERAEQLTNDADDIPESEKDFSDRVTDKALLEATPAVNIWIAQVQRQLKTWRRQGLTLQQIRDRLPALYKKLKSEAFAKTLNQSMQLTYLGTRAEAMDELEDESGEEDES